jgi:hypothetical protein
MSRSADLLRWLDDDPLRAANAAEPVAVLVAPELADELGAAGEKAGGHGIDVLEDEWNLIGSTRRWPSGSARGDIRPDALELRDAVERAALDRPVPCSSSPSSTKHIGRGHELVNHDADVGRRIAILLDRRESRSGRGARRRKDRARLHLDGRPADIRVPRADRFAQVADRAHRCERAELPASAR